MDKIKCSSSLKEVDRARHYEMTESSEESSPLESDEEEVLVYVDFEGTVMPNTFCNEKLQLDMIGLDSEHPIMQVNGKYYEGTYEDAIGTYMFFEKNENPEVDDEVFDKIPNLKFNTKSRKVLKMKRVFVKPRQEVLGDSSHPDCIPNIETIKKAGVPPRYQTETLLMWEQMRNEKIKGLNEYLEKQKRRKTMREQGIEPESESDEDSPFVMYKPESDKSFEDPKDKDPELACDSVIDPRPSTSKDNFYAS